MDSCCSTLNWGWLVGNALSLAGPIVTLLIGLRVIASGQQLELQRLTLNSVTDWALALIAVLKANRELALEMASIVYGGAYDQAKHDAKKDGLREKILETDRALEVMAARLLVVAPSLEAEISTMAATCTLANPGQRGSNAGLSAGLFMKSTDAFEQTTLRPALARVRARLGVRLVDLSAS
jgi:hypothetical protein